jgi:copper chaperone NosL
VNVKATAMTITSFSLGRRSFVASLFALSTLGSCGGGEPAASAQSAGARCAHCGMRVPTDPSAPGWAWRAGLTTASGEELFFDAPKCMFRVLRGERGAGAREAWVVEYYAGERRPAASLFYVIGADVQSPMGRDLVPVEGRERAERFSRDHHAQRVMSYDEVTSAVIDTLFRPTR